MRRRAFIASIVAASLVPGTARAQPRRMPRLGILLAGNREPFRTLFWDGMGELGYLDGKNIEAQLRSAEGKLDRLPAMAAELVQLGVDIIIASETPAVAAAKRQTGEIPIVMAPSGDPVGSGLVASLANPGGNVTGLSAATAMLAGKTLELIRELLPSARRVAVVADPANSFTRPFVQQVELAGGATGVEIHKVMVAADQSLDAAFGEIARARVEAAIVQPTLPSAVAAGAAHKHRLPAVAGNRAFAEAGGLLSYAGSLADRYRNAAYYVDKLLKGAKPADLPGPAAARASRQAWRP